MIEFLIKKENLISIQLLYKTIKIQICKVFNLILKNYTALTQSSNEKYITFKFFSSSWITDRLKLLYTICIGSHVFHTLVQDIQLTIYIRNVCPGGYFAFDIHFCDVFEEQTGNRRK